MSILPHALAAAILLGVAAQESTAWADDAQVPVTGSAQGEIVPNALPDGGPPHARVNEGRLVAPSGQTPIVSSAQGIQPPNSLPGATRPIGEAYPHSDATSPAGLIPQPNEGAPHALNSRS
jgi:hypothetical protein